MRSTRFGNRTILMTKKAMVDTKRLQPPQPNWSKQTASEWYIATTLYIYSTRNIAIPRIKQLYQYRTKIIARLGYQIFHEIQQYEKLVSRLIMMIWGYLHIHSATECCPIHLPLDARWLLHEQGHRHCPHECNSSTTDLFHCNAGSQSVDNT